MLDFELVGARTTRYATCILPSGRARHHDVGRGVRVHIGQACETTCLQTQLTTRLVDDMLVMSLDAETLVM